MNKFEVACSREAILTNKTFCFDLKLILEVSLLLLIFFFQFNYLLIKKNNNSLIDYYN